MLRVLRRIFRVALALCALAAIALAAVWWIATRSLPDYDAAYAAPGVTAGAEVVRDANAIPHIFARNEADAFFALGFAHAQDRLWQMDVSRKWVQGRLAEFLDPALVASDVYMRTLGLARSAERSYGVASQKSRAALEAYSAGVNAYIGVTQERGYGGAGPEYLLAAFGPEPWRPEDSLIVLKGMALMLSQGVAQETRRQRAALRLRPEQLRDLFAADGESDAPEPVMGPPPPAAAPGDAPAEAPAAPDLAPQEQTLLREPLDPLNPDIHGASNAWAVSGKRSATRASLLASDPHLMFSAPGVWYLADVQSPGYSAIGATLPGVPAIVAGRNTALGWGVTAANIDDQDLYLEQIDPSDPGFYKASDGWRSFGVRAETIRLRGQGERTLTIRETKHGPVLPEEGRPQLASITPAGHVLSLAWTALANDDKSYDALIELGRAQTLEAAKEAARLHVAPALALVVADRNDVGLIVAGRAPLRSAAHETRGRAPSRGWIADNEWIGVTPFEDLPHRLRPKGGAIATANNKLTNKPFPFNLSYDWDADFRERRILRRLEEREFHTPASFQAIQSDNVSEMARRLAPLMGEGLWETAEGAAPRRAHALGLLAKWTGDMSIDAPEPLIFYAWLRALTRAVAADELGDLFAENQRPDPAFLERVLSGAGDAAKWCDDVTTIEIEDCRTIRLRALDAALDDLSRKWGPDVAAWRWGRAHHAAHRNGLFGAIEKRIFGVTLSLASIVNIEMEIGGGDYTISRSQSMHSDPDPFLSMHGSGYRGVYNFADLDRSSFIAAIGQSGHPLSRHYAEFAESWAAGAYLPMSMSRADAEIGAVGRLTLAPAAKNE